MFPKSARLYDAVYGNKNYQREALKLGMLIKQYKRSEGSTLLDIGCGTGTHLTYLKDNFEVEGLDLDGAMLEVAREQLPAVPFHHADMLDFNLGRQFDVVICLFSVINYLKTVPRLRETVANMTRHLKPGGVLIIEPWLLPQFYTEGKIYAQFVDEPELKITRMTRGYRQNEVCIMEFQFLVGTPDRIEHFTEIHEFGLFSDEEFQEAMTAAGLKVFKDFPGLANMGLYIGVNS